MKYAVTVSLVAQARGGPFVYWDDLSAAIVNAAQLGYDAIEIFAPDDQYVDRQQLHSELQQTGLKVAAVGTGAGMVVHQLQLCDSDADRRKQAVTFIKKMIDFGGEFQAPAIIGSMQGRWTPAEGKPAALARLSEALQHLGEYAAQYHVPLIYEPLNRYETNLFNLQSTAVQFLEREKIANVVLLADLFHMNIEEADLAHALTATGKYLGHIHCVDSNRQAAGRGHLDFEPIAKALSELNYNGYLSAEAFAIPDADTAAAQTIETYRKYFPRHNG